MLRWIVVVFLLSGQVMLRAENRYFVCVGVDAYTSPLVTQLRGAENDAQLVSAALTKYGGFIPAGGGSWLLSTADGTAGRVDILKAIHAVAESARPEDSFVFFFAGHGVIRQRKSYLVTHDTDIREERIAATGLSADALREAIAGIASQRKLVILDACRNDPLPSRSGGSSLSEEFVRGLKVVPALRLPRLRQKRLPRFTATLYSCGPNERAFERPFEKPVYGFFSFHLFQALKQASTSGRPYSIKQLVSELEEDVSDATKAALGVAQEPWVEISGRYIDEWSITARVNDDVPDPDALARVEQPVATLDPVTASYGVLNVASNPKGAKILLNGRSTGKSTPARMDGIQTGNVVMTLKRAGYRTVVKELLLRPDAEETVSVDLTRVMKRVRAH